MDIPASYKGLTGAQIAMYASLRKWRKNYTKFCAAESYSNDGDEVYLDDKLLPLGSDYCACCKHEEKHGLCPITNGSCGEGFGGCFKEYRSFCNLLDDNADIVEVRIAVKAICSRIEKAITDSLERDYRLGKEYRYEPTKESKK